MPRKHKTGRKPLPHDTIAITQRLKAENVIALRLLARAHGISQRDIMDRALEFALHHPKFTLKDKEQ